jgi:glycosyltransferase involved in cell wall biosynthesis
LVNDGSVDKSQEIIERYKKKYPNKIKAYTQKNSGIATTRNNGIKYSSGKYLFFIDNDDYIDPNYVETFVNEIEERKCDVVIGGYRRVTEEGKILYLKQPIDSPWSKYMFITPWGRVYRKDALVKNNISFLNLNIGEDVGLNINANLKLKVETIPYTGYNWVDKKTSTSNTLHKGMKKNVDFIPLLEKIKEYSKSTKISKIEESLLEYFIVKTAIYYILHSGRKTEYTTLKTEAKHIFNWVRENYPKYSKNKNISPFRPKGEVLSIRMIVWIYIFLQKLHLENTFLWVYSKL